MSRTRQIPNAERIYKSSAPSVVLIGTDDSFGAGIVIGKEEILTNFHVVDGYEMVQFILWEKEYTTLGQIDPNQVRDAVVVAVDVKRDLALIKPKHGIEANSRYAKFGSNYSINIAQDVFAIGHPEGLVWSFTYGVISGLPSPYEWKYSDGTVHRANCVQTQTPINPGNSGGPLFNSEGKVIGINSMGLDAQGLNFAVRLNEFKDFLNRARNGEYPQGNKSSELEWEEILDHDFEGISELWGSDSNNDGYFDIWIIFEDKDDQPDIGLFDISGDHSVDTMTDYETGIWYIDDDSDGEFDREGRDTDDDGWPDVFD